MKKQNYLEIENYMLSSMEDSAHDKEHIYRVLYTALDIAKNEENVNYEVLIAACLLHDIGRKEQFENPELCHARVGGDKAYDFLIKIGKDKEVATRVKEAIISHRFRANNPPQSLEAKIVFDADKIDVTGAIGIARAIFYKGQMMEPLYSKALDGTISNGENDSQPSFFHEYKFKLEKLYDKFYTKRGTEIGKERQAAAISYYENILREVESSYQNGSNDLNELLE
jgi:uncharacterized protein